MSQNTSRPRIEIIPDRSAVCSTRAVELNILVRITPPVVEKKRERPPLNLGLIIDRSGSMAGAELTAAKAAATYVVRKLTSRDRVSVTVFDDEVETIVPSTLVTNPDVIVAAINRIESGGSTALHDGWVQGGMQVGKHLESGALNRVILLTDGQANHGETRLETIVSNVRGLAQRGVSTTTMGVGVSFNEDLLLAMADAGDGNYHFIEAVSQFQKIFQKELFGVMSTFGRTVSLGLEPRNGARVKDVYNDMKRNSMGRLMLPNLVAEKPIQILARIKVPACATPTELFRARLAWTDPRTEERQKLREVLTLPVVSAEEWEALEQNPEVIALRSKLEISRYRQRAAEALDAGDDHSATQLAAQGIAHAQTTLSAADAADEVEMLEAFRTHVLEGRRSQASKSSKFASYQRRTSRD